MEAPNYLLPGITAAATGLAAIISGFFAAALKHRWDVQDDERRWQRERAERRREELKLAFNQYLTTRAEVEALLTQKPEVGVVNEATQRVSVAVRSLIRESTQLRVLLEDATTVNKDMRDFGDWVNAILNQWVGTAGPHLVVPSDELIRRLAKQLLE